MPWITSTSIKFQVQDPGWKVFNRWQLLKPPSPPQPSSSGCWTPQPGDDYDVNVVHEREPGDSGDDVGDVGGDDGYVDDLELPGDDAQFRLHCISSCEVAELLSGKMAMSHSLP